MSIFTAEELAAIKGYETSAWPDVDLRIETPFQIDIMPDAQFAVFTIQPLTITKVNGNLQPSYPDNGTISAVLGIPTQEQMDHYEQAQHPINYTLNHKGNPIAKVDDRFKLGTRYFYVRGVLQPNGPNIWTQYLVNEEFGK